LIQLSGALEQKVAECEDLNQKQIEQHLLAQHFKEKAEEAEANLRQELDWKNV